MREFSIYRYQDYVSALAYHCLQFASNALKINFCNHKRRRKYQHPSKGEINSITYFKVFVATTRNLPRVINHERVATFIVSCCIYQLAQLQITSQ